MTHFTSEKLNARKIWEGVDLRKHWHFLHISNWEFFFPTVNICKNDWHCHQQFLHLQIQMCKEQQQFTKTLIFSTLHWWRNKHQINAGDTKLTVQILGLGTHSCGDTSVIIKQNRAHSQHYIAYCSSKNLLPNGI